MQLKAAIVKEKAIQVEGEGEVPVQIVETNFRYPLLARWPKTKPVAPTVAHTAANPQEIHVGSPAAADKPEEEVWAVAGHLLARLQTPEQVNAAARIMNRDDLEMRKLSTGFYRIGPAPSSPGFTEAGAQGEILAKLPELRAEFGENEVEPDYLYCIAQTPDDPDFSLQDSLQTIGAPEAWDVQRGSHGVRVAIIDTGIDFNHPDLAANILYDENSRLVGWDFHNGKPTPDDDNGHGTLCAGLVGAVGNNALGMTGVNWEVSILPIKAFGEFGFGATSHLAAAVDFAVRKGANVILCAWGSCSFSQCLFSAIDRAHQEGVLVVAAAGNERRNLDVSGHYPAAFNLPNMISVGGTDENDQPVLAWGHGQKRVHVSAPGMQVYSTVPTRFRPYLPYDRSNGTSPAAALVAGASALLKAQFPKSSHIAIRNRLLSNVDKSDAFQGANSSGGRLNLANAIDPKKPLPLGGGDRKAMNGSGNSAQP